jgi:3-oxoacyl-[acyl-carrier-protein] synthase III
MSDTPVIIPKKNIGIIAVGSYLPPKIVENKDFTRLKLTEQELQFIKQLSGIKKRYFANGETYTDLAIKAAQNAIENSNLQATDIDLVIVTHVSRDMSHFTPPNCIKIQTDIGADKATSMNIDVGFGGWLYALITGVSFIASGFYKHILIVSGETLIENTSNDIMKALLVGDGAGAFILGETLHGYGIKGFHLASKNHEGQAAEVKIMGGYPGFDETSYSIKPYFTIAPNSFQIDMPYVEKLVPSSINEILSKLKLKSTDIDLYIFAQKFKGLNMKWAENIGIDYSKVHDTLESTACLETASIPVITHDAIVKGKLNKGDLLMFSDLGARWTVSSVLLKWEI